MFDVREALACRPAATNRSLSDIFVRILRWRKLGTG